jgi:ADP-ribose pyrophosphatase YjhB (NUDIX family)
MIIEYIGETAAEAIRRELVEEFDLFAEIGSLACINENIFEFDGKKGHDCTLVFNRILKNWRFLSAQ